MESPDSAPPIFQALGGDGLCEACDNEATTRRLDPALGGIWVSFCERCAAAIDKVREART